MKHYFPCGAGLIARDHLQAYRLYTNGPSIQEIAYLHFHLVAEEPNLAGDHVSSGNPANAHFKLPD